VSAVHKVIYITSPTGFNVRIRFALLFALVASAIGLFWHWMGRPVAVLASPLAQGQKLNCLSYAPFHNSQAALRSARCAFRTNRSNVRTYPASPAKITRIADKVGLKVLQGIWIGRNRAGGRLRLDCGSPACWLKAPELASAVDFMTIHILALLGGSAGHRCQGYRACARGAEEGRGYFWSGRRSGSARWAGRARGACATAPCLRLPIRLWC
jgi:hypothetical protein